MLKAERSSKIQQAHWQSLCHSSARFTVHATGDFFISSSVSYCPSAFPAHGRKFEITFRSGTQNHITPIRMILSWIKYLTCSRGLPCIVVNPMQCLSFQACQVFHPLGLLKDTCQKSLCLSELNCNNQLPKNYGNSIECDQISWYGGKEQIWIPSMAAITSICFIRT